MNERIEKLVQYYLGKGLSVDVNWAFSEAYLERSMFSQEEGIEAYLDSGIYSVNGEYRGSVRMIKDIPKDSIIVPRFTGFMDTESYCSAGIDSVDVYMRSLYANKNVKGIVFQINSGGGTTVAGDVLGNSFADRNKPVIAYPLFAASAAYKAISYSDEIIAASDSVLVGNIGTMVRISTSKLKEDPDYITLYSRHSPNKAEHAAGIKDKTYKSIIDRLTEIDEVFMDIVSNNRPLKGDPSIIMDGRTYLANKGKDVGLVDSIGTLSHALSRMGAQIKYYK